MTANLNFLSKNNQKSIDERYNELLQKKGVLENQISEANSSFSRIFGKNGSSKVSTGFTNLSI